MATGIVDSMFGIKSPEEYQQDYLSGMLIAPSQMGNQSLYQQLVSTMANAGTMLGYGGGRLLGGRTSGEVEAAAVNNVLKTVSEQGYTNESDKFRAAALLFQEQGMGKQAEQAMVKYREALKEERSEADRQRTLAQGKFENVYEVVRTPLTDDVGAPVLDSKGNPIYTSKNVQRTIRFDNNKNAWFYTDTGKEYRPGNAAQEEATPQQAPQPTPTPAAKLEAGSKGRTPTPDQSAAYQQWLEKQKGKSQGSLKTPETISDIGTTMARMADVAAPWLTGGGRAAEAVGISKAAEFVQSSGYPIEVIRSNKWVQNELKKKAKAKGIPSSAIDSLIRGE